MTQITNKIDQILSKPSYTVQSSSTKAVVINPLLKEMSQDVVAEEEKEIKDGEGIEKSQGKYSFVFNPTAGYSPAENHKMRMS